MDGRERARWDRSDRSIGEELGERGGRVPRSVLSLSRRASIDVFSSGGKTSIWEGQTVSNFPFRLLNAATPSLAKAYVHESDLAPVDHLFSEIIIDI